MIMIALHGVWEKVYSHRSDFQSTDLERNVVSGVKYYGVPWVASCPIAEPLSSSALCLTPCLGVCVQNYDEARIIEGGGR